MVREIYTQLPSPDPVTNKMFIEYNDGMASTSVNYVVIYWGLSNDFQSPNLYTF